MGTQKFKGFQDQYEPRGQKYFTAIKLQLLQIPLVTHLTILLYILMHENSTSETKIINQYRKYRYFSIFLSQYRNSWSPGCVTTLKK